MNPFLYGRPLDSVEGLVGRDVELEELLGCVRSGQAVMVYGPRRYGKTRLARVVEGRAREENMGSQASTSTCGERAVSRI
jgi:AAA+ ATPase superfamily predicted ATPase